MDRDLKELQNFLFDEKVPDSDVSLYFASYLEAFRDFDAVIDQKDMFETALCNLAKREDDLPDFSNFEPSFEYDRYTKELFARFKEEGSMQLPIEDLNHVYSFRDPSASRLFVIGEAKEAYKYLLVGLKDYKNKAVYVFGGDSSEEYEIAFNELEDTAPINVAEAYEGEADINSLFFHLVNVVEYSGSEDRIDIVLLKDEHQDVQREFIDLVSRYQYRDQHAPRLRIYIENKELFDEFKDNPLCVAYDERFFSSLVRFEIECAVRNLKEYKGEIDVTYFGEGKNNLALAQALDSSTGFSQRLYSLKGILKERAYESIFENVLVELLQVESNELSAYSAKGMIFVDTGDFEKDIICIKSIREKNKDIPIYWLHRDEEKMIVFKHFFLDERLYLLSKITFNIADSDIRGTGCAFNKKSEDEEELDDLLMPYGQYSYLAYRLSRDEPPFDKTLIDKARTFAQNGDFISLKDIYQAIEGKTVCHLEDFKTKAKGIIESIFARLKVLYYLGKYAPSGEFETDKVKLSVVRYAKIISFAGGYEWVSNSFGSLIDDLIPYFVKGDKKDANLLYIFKLILSIYKVYEQSVFSETACKIHMISLLFDMQNGSVNDDLYLERMAYPCFEVLSFHSEDDETEYSETYVSLYKELAKYIQNARCSDKYKLMVEKAVDTFDRKSASPKEIREAFDDLASISIGER